MKQSEMNTDNTPVSHWPRTIDDGENLRVVSHQAAHRILNPLPYHYNPWTKKYEHSSKRKAGKRRWWQENRHRYKKIDLHLVSWNRLPMTELVIRTIHRNTNRDNFRLVVLDNGSDGDIPERLEALHDNGLIDEFIPIKTNLGLEAARNLLLQECTQSDYFVCVDNDCLIMPKKGDKDWLEELYELIQYFKDYAAIAARTQVMIGTGNIFEKADRANELIVDFPHPGGSYRIMDTKRVWEVGGWSREAPGRGQEEKFICGKLHGANYETAFATEVRCLHLFGPQGTDRWGYPGHFKPEDSGHSNVYHPALEQGDDEVQLLEYAAKRDVKEYFDAFGSDKG